MPASMGRLTPGSQYYQASGEATPQQKLPEKFISNPVATSPIGGHLDVPGEPSYNIRRAPVVHRIPILAGFRQLYQRGAIHMQVRRLGADGQPYPWNSAAQRDMMGPIRNSQFYDALYMAGYPGINLGLSFKAPQLQTLPAGARGFSISPTPGNIDISRRTLGQGRAKGVQNLR